MILKYGMYRSMYEKTYMVSGLKEYPQKNSDISDDLISKVDTVVKKFFSDFKQVTYNNKMILNFMQFIL